MAAHEGATAVGEAHWGDPQWTEGQAAPCKQVMQTSCKGQLGSARDCSCTRCWLAQVASGLMYARLRHDQDYQLSERPRQHVAQYEL